MAKNEMRSILIRFSDKLLNNIFPKVHKLIIFKGCHWCSCNYISFSQKKFILKNVYFKSNLKAIKGGECYNL